MAQNRVRLGQLRFIDTATMLVGGNWYPVDNGGLLAGFDFPVAMLRISNNSNVDIVANFNPFETAVPQEFIAKGTSVLLNFQQMAIPNSYITMLRAGTFIRVQSAAAGVGLVYVSAYGPLID